MAGYVNPMTFEQNVSAARQEVRIIGGLRSPENRGKITLTMAGTP